MSAGKVCKLCGRWKRFPCYHKGKGAGGRHSYCKPCMSSYKRHYRSVAENWVRELARERARKPHLTRIRDRAREYRLSMQRNKGQIRQRIREWKSKARHLLWASMVRESLWWHTRGPRSPVPPDLLAIRKAQLTINRQLRALKEAINGKKQ